MNITVNLPFLPPTVGVSPPGTMELKAVQWPNSTSSGIIAEGDSITAAFNFGNSKGSGLPIILNGGTGLRAILEFTHTNIGTYDLAGFTTAVMTGNFAYAFQLDGSYWTIVVEESKVPGKGGTFTESDEFRLELYGDKVVWKLNNIILHTEPGAPASDYSQLYASVLLYVQGSRFPSFKLWTGAIPNILPPVDGSILSVDASAQVTDVVAGFAPLQNALFTKDGIGAFSKTIGAKRRYEPVFASYFRLDAPKGRGFIGSIGLQITRQGESAPIYNEVFVQNGTSTSSTPTRQITLSLDRYIVEVIHVTGSQVGFDGISVRR